METQHPLGISKLLKRITKSKIHLKIQAFSQIFTNNFNPLKTPKNSSTKRNFGAKFNSGKERDEKITFFSHLFINKSFKTPQHVLQAFVYHVKRNKNIKNEKSGKRKSCFSPD